MILSSCSSYKLALLNHNDPMYPVEYVIPIAEDTKIDTLSFSQFRWKLRTDFSFRWDYAQYAMNQPYNWYSSFSYNVWRPFNSFDVYFNRYNFWYDWAFNYPYYWGFSSWHNPWRHHWYRPYNWGYSWYNGPWHNPGYNIIWNSSRENNNVAYISGRRGSRNIDININNNNIENTIVRRYNNPRKNVDNSNLNNIVNILRDNYNVKPRVYNNPNNISNNNVIRNNSGRPVINNYNNNNNFSNSNINSRSSSPVRSYSSPPSSNISRGSSVSNGGSSRGGNSRGKN
tara:strand:+ start:109 stop:963 length:855 start_codon:yes stop_codon:yes gene_type:complete